jgi:hypothetical protein
MMQAFTYSCAAAFPSVIPLYVTGQDLGEESCFETCNLRQLMTATARAHGVKVESAAALKGALVAAGRQMFVILDEIDQLYRIDAARPALRLNIMNTLEFLGVLGNQRTGIFSVLLCGSSAATYKLVCGDSTAIFHDKYPLLKGGVPDLNSTKFKELLIPSAPCNDSKQVFGIIKSLQLWPDAAEGERFQNARILTFLGGTTPRAVTSATDVKSKGAVSAKRMQELVNDQLRGTRMLTSTDKHAASAFFQTVLRLLQAENAGLIARLRNKDGSCKMEELVREADAALLLGSDDTAPHAAAAPADFGVSQLGESALAPASDGDPGAAEDIAAAAAPWERLVRPVALDDVVRAWREQAKADQRPMGDEYVDWLLGVLSDATLVSVRQEAGKSGRYVWPASAAQLVFSHTDSVGVAVMEEIVRRLRPFSSLANELQPFSTPLRVF